MQPRWALFLSGRGSTAAALLDLVGTLDIRVVVSSRRLAPGILRARRVGVPILVLDTQVDWRKLALDLKSKGINRILLVGFMKILPADFLEQFSGGIWNIHPSLLPLYPGAQALEKSFSSGSDLGVTIHDVTPEMDAGTIRIQSKLQKKIKSWSEVQLQVARLEQKMLRTFALKMNVFQKQRDV